MAVGGVFEYANINARVRAIYSTLFTPPEWIEFINATDFASLVGLLRPTDYGPYLMQVDEKELTPRRAVFQIKKQMADTFATVLRTAPEPTRPLLIQFYRDFEVDNLKALLRGILSGASWDQLRYFLFPMGSLGVLPAQAMVQSGNIAAAVELLRGILSGASWDQLRYFLFPMGSLGVLPAQAMVQSGNIAAAVELLRGTPYYATLSHAMRRYNAEQSLFPLEVALDLNYWRAIWKETNQLAKRDRLQALEIVGSLLDMNNLMWAIRYRVYYNLSEEELINYTLSYGHRVRDADVRAIAAGAEIPQIVSRVYPNLADVYSLFLEPRKGLSALEVKLQRIVRSHCEKAMVGYPFHIGVPLAFLVLKKMEIQDLTVLIEAKSSGMSGEAFRPYLVLSETSK
jgi:vacuolar-type H+-ATPase subunit C/Vma6